MKVLVAVDNKPSSQAVVDALIKMHWYEGTEIGLLTVFPPEIDIANPQQEFQSLTNEMESMAVELHDTLKQCEVSYLPRSGDPKTAILDVAAQSHADLIVVGSNCKSTLERLLLGSVCQSVLNSAHCPVIVAKTPCCLAREASPAFKNILLPVDNSIFSDAAVQWLANFEWAPDTRFIIAAVVDYDTDFEQVKQSLNKRAWDLSKFINTRNIVVEIETGSPQEQIIQLAKKYYADLILMGAHGQTGLKDMILGSVAHSVSHVAPCAVAMVRGTVSVDRTLAHEAAFRKAKPVAPAGSPNGFRERDDDLTISTMPAGF